MSGEQRRMLVALVVLGLLALFIWWQQPLPAFTAHCRGAATGSEARATVALILEQAGTEDCAAAQQWLESRRSWISRIARCGI